MSHPETAPKATVKTTTPFSSVVWLIPLLALLTGAWLLFQHIRNTGPEITLYMNNADGIEINNTVIKVLNVTVGKVTAIKIRANEQGVAITAQLNADVKDMIRKDTQFWVVKPRIDQSGITGLNTLVSGSYIAFTPGHSQETADTFQVADLPPASAIGQNGLRLRLIGSSDKLLVAGSPVLYGDISVGQIEKADFNPTNKTVHYQIYINSPYNQLVGKNVQFWLQTGLRIEASGGGVHIDSAPIPALLSGAIVFKEPAAGKGSAVSSDAEFTLYNSYVDLQSQPSTRALYYVAFFKQSVRGLRSGAPVEYQGINIGSVADVPYFAHNDSHQLFSKGWIPVRIRIEPSRMEINANPQDDAIWRRDIQAALIAGLSASLESDNLITGNLYVQLAQATPGTPTLRPSTTYQNQTVIATRSSGLGHIQDQLSDLLSKINKLPLDQSVRELNGTLAQLQATLGSANKLLAQDKTQRLPDELAKTLAELRQTLQGVSPQSPLYGNIQSTLQSIDHTLKAAQPTLRTLQQQPNALIFNRQGHDPIPKGSR